MSSYGDGSLFSMILSLCAGIVTLVSYWRIFSKAGEAGWKAIIPIYGTYVLYQFTWTMQMFWMMIGSYVLGFILMVAGMAVGVSVLSFLGFAVMIIGVIIDLFQSHALSRAFGHGFGFTLGLLFLTPVFLLILAFGSSEYQGPQR